MKSTGTVPTVPMESAHMSLEIKDENGWRDGRPQVAMIDICCGLDHGQSKVFKPKGGGATLE